MQIKTLVFNPFQENTYILFDETKECAIVDAGMLTQDENKHLEDVISQMGLKPVLMLQTHLHLDHVFGGQFVSKKYNLQPQAHADDEFFIEITKDYAVKFGVKLESNPPPLGKRLAHGDIIEFGNTKLEVIHVAGHSPGGILFYNQDSKILVSGDVLFAGSVGRSDLAGGDHEALITGITDKIMILPDDVTVYPGHGPQTSIGKEKNSNPFLS